MADEGRDTCKSNTLKEAREDRRDPQKNHKDETTTKTPFTQTPKYSVHRPSMGTAEFSREATKNPGGLLDMFNLVPEGHEKALKQAFYNTIAIILVSVIAVAAVAVRYILEPFLRPLLWALLFGSVLHPFKRTLTVTCRQWLQNLEDRGTPLVAGVVMLPIGIADRCSDKLSRVLLNNAKPIVGAVGLAILAYLMYTLLPSHCLSTIFFKLLIFCNYISHFLDFFKGASYIVGSLAAGYLILTWLVWKPDQQHQWLKVVGLAVWTLVLLHLTCIAGPLRVPLLLGLVGLGVVGMMLPSRDEVDSSGSGRHFPPIYPLQVGWTIVVQNIFSQSALDSFLGGTEEEEERKPASHSTPVGPTSPPNISRILAEDTGLKLSNLYLNTVFWACVVVEFWRHPWTFHLLPIPLVYMLAKALGSHLGVWTWLSTYITAVKERLAAGCKDREDVLLPPLIRHGVWGAIRAGDTIILRAVRSSLDTVTSIGVIIGVLVAAVMAGVFLAVQVYGESVHLVGVASSLVNRTLVNNPEIQELLPESLQNLQTMFDSVLGDAYLYSRQWLANSVHRFIDDKDPGRAAMLEKQILDLWDRVYHQWVSGNLTKVHRIPDMHHMGPLQRQQSASFDSLVDGFKTLNLELIATFIQENIGILMTVLDSIWAVIKGNISLAFTALTAIFSMLFGGGTAVLNFFINFCVFSTALFYLLCSSEEAYKPWEMFTQMLPSGTKLGQAVEESINGVFAASFKMAAFYGLYTWLTHTVFDVKVVYMPTVFSAVCGAIPFLGPYWSCLPAVLELWLVQGQVFRALFMIAVQLFPTSFVDSAIYAEIKGGHPYLTGLAIAGGIFCFGVEGALFGPLLLCFFCVLVNLYSGIVQDMPLDDTGRRSSRHLFRRMFTID